MNQRVLVFVVVLTAISTSGSASERCKRGEDCEADECCVNYADVPFFGGYCEKLKQKGQSCALEKQEHSDMYYFKCPCKEGLKCFAEYEIKRDGYVIGHHPMCIIPGEYTFAPKPETTVLTVS